MLLLHHPHGGGNMHAIAMVFVFVVATQHI
jgi:hypothetical protein